MIKKFVLATMVASSMAAVTLPAAAVTYVRVAPPAARVEVVPAPRHGYAWAPGHWDYRRNHYVWVAGTWIRERPGYVYAQPEWRQRDGRWYLEQGRWARGDRDHDGVPNGVDRRPNDPNHR